MNRIQRHSLAIAAAYVTVTALWILLSDRLLLAMTPPDALETLAALQSIKGAVFVLVTGGLLYWLIAWSLTRQARGDSNHRELIEHSPIAILVQVDGRVCYANTAAGAMFRASDPQALIGREIMQLLDGAYHNTVRQRIAEMQQTGLPSPPLEEVWNRLDGSKVHTEVAAIPVLWQRQQAIQVILHDLSEAKAYAARLSHVTTHDPLTNLANRNLLNDRIEQEIIHAGRVGRSTALLVLDIARLQLINDSYGYEAGDLLLTELAASLLQTVRPGDTVARIAGDQFAVLLSDLHDRSGMLTAIEKIRSTLIHTYRVADNEVYVNLHSGVAVWPEDGENADTLLKNAIAASYRAKKSGSTEPEFYARSISDEARQRVTMEQAIIDAIANNEFVLHYQPKISSRTGAIAGCEALIRWNSPKLGMVPPNRFIPLAEETSHIQQIGDWVLREACRQMAQWRSQGLGVLPTAVNLSALQLRQPGLQAMLSELIHQYELEPSALELELTESMIMGNTKHASTAINQLRAMGLKLSLDDFGTGYSSFSYLKTFRLDYLKIDMSFVRDLLRSEDNARITQSIVTLGHGLGMQVIAEGVETAEQARLLERMGCDLFQGYYFSRPVDAAAFSAMLPGRFTWSGAEELTHWASTS